MAYKDYIVRDRPAAAWIIGPNGDLVDYSGHGLNGSTGLTQSGSYVDSNGITRNWSVPVRPNTAVPIIANSTSSVRAGSGNPLTLPNPGGVMTGAQVGDFSLEAWFLPTSVTSETTVLGFEGGTTGITFDGDAIRFRVGYAGVTNSLCTYFPPVEKKVFHVVAVHAQNRNILYVDGVAVAEQLLTPEQAVANHFHPNANKPFMPGYSDAGTNLIALDGMAIYTHSLSPSKIRKHYREGRDVPNPLSVIEDLGGSYWSLTDEQAKISMRLDFGPWSSGTYSNVYLSDGAIRPEIDASGLTYGGTWVYGSSLVPAGSTINGSKIEWDGDGAFTVQTSIDDGLNWTTCTNGREVPGISTGFNASGKSLSIRISFLTGEPEADTISKVRSLNVKLYSSRDVVNNQGSQFVQLFGSGTLGTANHEPIDQNAFMGANLYDAYAKITPINLPTGSTTTAAISFWFKPESLDASDHLFDLRTQEGNGSLFRWSGTRWVASSATVYVNGTQQGTDSLITVGEWNFITAVFDLPTADVITVGARYDGIRKTAMRLAGLAAYRAPLSASDVSTIYRSYLGVDTRSVAEPNTITILDLTPKTHAYDWSYIGG